MGFLCMWTSRSDSCLFLRESILFHLVIFYFVSSLLSLRRLLFFNERQKESRYRLEGRWIEFGGECWESGKYMIYCMSKESTFSTKKFFLRGRKIKEKWRGSIISKRVSYFSSNVVESRSAFLIMGTDIKQ